MSLSQIARTNLMLICTAILPMAATAGFDALPSEVRARDSATPRTFTWERTLKVERDAAFDHHAWFFVQGVKNTERILANPTAVKPYDPVKWEEIWRPRFENDLANYKAGKLELETNTDAWEAYADRDGVFIEDVAPELLARRTTHQDVRDLTAIKKRWKDDRHLSFILANWHLNVVEDAHGDGVYYTDLDRSIRYGGGARNERERLEAVQTSLLWAGLLSDHWDAWGSINTSRTEGDRNLESVTVRRGSLISQSIKWTFHFDETEAARLVEARCEANGGLMESYKFQGWANFDGVEYPTSVTCQKFDWQANALESTETRTLISVEPLDPKTIWD